MSPLSMGAFGGVLNRKNRKMPKSVKSRKGVAFRCYTFSHKGMGEIFHGQTKGVYVWCE